MQRRNQKKKTNLPITVGLRSGQVKCPNNVPFSNVFEVLTVMGGLEVEPDDDGGVTVNTLFSFGYIISATKSIYTSLES